MVFIFSIRASPPKALTAAAFFSNVCAFSLKRSYVNGTPQNNGIIHLQINGMGGGAPCRSIFSTALHLSTV